MLAGYYGNKSKMKQSVKQEKSAGIACSLRFGLKIVAKKS